MKPTKLQRAMTALVLDHPFFGSILLKRGLKPRDDIPTAAVDQRGQIYYNPSFVEGLSVPELVFLLAHEVGHVIAQHAARRGTRDPRRWNIAGDAWINDMLQAAEVGQFIKGGVDIPGSKDKTTERIYEELSNPSDGHGNDSGGSDDGTGDTSGNSGNSGSNIGGIGEDLLEEGAPLTKEEAERLDAETRVEIAQAAKAAKMVGKMPAALERMVADLCQVATPWYEILERHMTAAIRTDYSWARPNRRYVSQGHYLPSVGSQPTMGVLVVQVDISGSITQLELAHYNGHLKRIVEQCNPQEVHVLYTDAAVQRHDTFEQGEEIRIEFYSGGGTYMPAGFDYLLDQGIEPDVFVCLTDGYTDFGTPPGYPVVWCISNPDITASHGETVHFEVMTGA
jgi:predicted metal-dependent peptidase